MREIKFRAWDASQNEMKYPELWDNTMPRNWKRWYKLMQFTGLHDKNGKEIYEGDIVVGGGCLKPMEVKWNIKGRWSFGNQLLDFTDSTIMQLQVIGNIYENPDLL